MLVTLQKNRILLAFVSGVVFLFLLAVPAFAQTDIGLGQAAQIGGGAFGTSDLRSIIVNIVNIALGFLGIIAVIIIIYGGWLWMTSGGNPEKLDRAKKTLINAAIGILVIISSYAIITFFTQGTINATQGGGAPGSGLNLGNGALGSGIVESVYPPPGARGIPRNTSIFVTFKEPMDPCTLITGSASCTSGNLAYAPLTPTSATNPDHQNFRIVDASTGIALVSNEVLVTTNAPLNTIYTFTPVTPIGNAFTTQLYRVEMMDRILKQNGDLAFPGSVSGIGFQWGFDVSNIIDITPPILVGYLPYPLSTNPRNVIISMRFNEAINPISVSSNHIRISIPSGAGNGGVCSLDGDCSSGDCDTTIGQCVGVDIVGTLFQAGDYKTIEFLPGSECEGQPLNTCGEPVFCFPADSPIETLVIADDFAPGLNGIQDAAQNSFDGDGSGIAEGPNAPPGGTDFDLGLRVGDGDNAFWNFLTNDVIDLVPPAIIERNPGPANSVSPPGFQPNLLQELMVKFDKHLSISTLRPDGSYGDGKEYVTLLDPTQQVGYQTYGTNGNGCSFQCLNEGSNSVFGSMCGVDGDPTDGLPGLLDRGEDCDDGNTISGDGCSANCIHEGTGTCGDGIVSHAEQCDINAEPWFTDGGCDTNTCVNLGTTACAIFSGTNCCGNGQVEAGETCDDTSDPGCNAGTAPSNTCLRFGNSVPPGTLGGYCGDGTIQPDLGEECDDGNSAVGYGCSNTCLPEGSACGFDADGDGFPKDPGEDCDNGSASCSGFCLNRGTTPLQCGDFILDQGEDCDLGPALNESFVFIDHTGLAQSQQYGIRMGSGIRDLYQNCFLPSAESPTNPLNVSCLTIPGNTAFGWVEASGPGTWPTGAFPNCLLP